MYQNGLNNMNLQYHNCESFSNEFLFSKELFSLIHYKVSNDLKGYQLLVFEDNRLLVHPTYRKWAIHVRRGRGYWNSSVLSNSFEVFSINDSQLQGYLSLNWLSHVLKEELNETVNNELLLEDSFSNRTMLINQIINVSTSFDILNDNSKFLKKSYWNNVPTFRKKVFQFI